MSKVHDVVSPVGSYPIATPETKAISGRWLQLILGVVCMVAAANIQYVVSVVSPGWDRPLMTADGNCLAVSRSSRSYANVVVKIGSVA